MKLENSQLKNSYINSEGVPEITVKELKEVMKTRPDIKLIDVRWPDEFTGELGHVEGAELCTLETELGHKLKTLPVDATYVFICRSGGRSSHATALAMSHGFKNVFNMAGGMKAWNIET